MEPRSESSPRTRERILTLLLHAPEPLSSPALATRLGISRNATHQHLSALERDGLVERASQISTRGRPSQGFRLSRAGEAMFPRQYALLARKLIVELARRLGPEALPATLAAIGEELARELTPRLGDDAQLPSIAELMRELGYEAHIGDAPDEIEAHNCVFHDLAMRDQAICALDLALLGTLSGRAVEHRSCMARGDRSCRFAFGTAAESPGAR
ncbi:MAG TPA: helix-turn-helix domain-containing protein [Croceibacterium sp.]|nr:helix-turn-helix domain-containing protein [Croceibacterium sp.]